MCTAKQASRLTSKELDTSKHHPAIIKLFCIFALALASFSTCLIAIKKHNILKIKQKVFLLHCRLRLRKKERKTKGSHSLSRCLSSSPHVVLNFLRWDTKKLCCFHCIRKQKRFMLLTEVTQLMQTTRRMQKNFFLRLKKAKQKKMFSYTLVTSITWQWMHSWV